MQISHYIQLLAVGMAVGMAVVTPFYVFKVDEYLLLLVRVHFGRIAVSRCEDDV